MPIKLIASSHISKDAAKNIRNTILQEKPEIVAIELDIHRLPSLFKAKQKFRLRDIQQLGLGGFLFAAIGSIIQKKLGNKVGLIPGADMKAAFIAGRKIKANIALIDQPINITLKRISKISVWEKLKLLTSFIFSNEKIEFDLNKVPDGALVLQLISILKKHFPQFYYVLIKERNQYMLKQLCTLQNQNPSSKIICVVGAGHIDGLKKGLAKQNISVF